MKLHTYFIFLIVKIFLILYSEQCFAMRVKIVNGTQARDGEFPFAVSLRYPSSGRHFCGGSLINRAWVLTAAHCVNNLKPAQLNIQYGSLLLERNSSKTMNVSKIFVHEGYEPQNHYIHDIALLKLWKPLDFGSKVRAVHLPDAAQLTPADSEAILIGWGLNATGGVTQQQLQKVYLQVFSDEECSERHQAQLHDTNICAGVPEGGKGQCSGDSGGPLLTEGKQVGIVSWSRKPCTTPPYPGVFTETSAYIDWIIETIGKENLEGSEESQESQGELISGNLIIVTRKNPLKIKNI